MVSVIDGYLTKIEPVKRQQLERIRQIAKKIVPEASEKNFLLYAHPTISREIIFRP